MSARSRGAVLAPAVLAAAAAELGARLLAPREALPIPVPIDVRSYFSEQEIARGRRYARPQLAIGLARAGLQLGLLAGLTVRERRTASPPRARIMRLVGLRRARERPGSLGIVRAAGAAAALAGAETAVGLPLTVIARRRSLAVGLSTQSWGAWAGDLVKSLAIEAGFAAGGGALIATLGRQRPSSWWAPAAAGSVVLGAALGALAPVVLDPLFNDFTPLPEGQLREDVLVLAADAGVKVGEVLCVDASRRTTAVNAYVAGLGPTKRVVLFDTLLERYSRDEIRTVVAHELAHVRHRDVPRGVLYGALVSGPAALAVERLAESLHPQPTQAAGLPALALAAAVVTGPVGLLGNRLSRALERRADAFAVRLSGAGEAFVSFERAIALQNVADVDPPAWVARLLATHPPTAERIGAAIAAGASRRTPGMPTPAADRPRTPADS